MSGRVRSVSIAFPSGVAGKDRREFPAFFMGSKAMLIPWGISSTRMEELSPLIGDFVKWKESRLWELEKPGLLRITFSSTSILFSLFSGLSRSVPATRGGNK